MLYVFCTICVFAGSLLQTVTGLGLAIIVMATLPFMLSLETSLAVGAILGVGHSIALLLTTPRTFSFRKIIIPVAACFAVSAVVARLMRDQSSQLMIRILGAFMILLSLYFLFFQREVHAPASVKGGAAAGCISGITGTLFGIHGPPLIVYYLATAESDEEYLANIRLTFLFTGIYTLGLRVWSGYITAEAITYGALGLAAMMAGIWAGNRLSKRVRGETLRKAVYGTMIFSGAIYLIRG